jgi:hypothetical protein
MPVAAAPAPSRAEVRRSRVDQGLQELDRWLTDQIRTGLAPLARLGYPHFDAIAARMVDAQAPGIAGLLRAVPAELGEQDWPDRVLHELSGLHLLSRAHGRIDELPPDLAATVRSRIGYPVAKADVLARPGVRDSWWPVGVVDVVDQTLRRRRIWLRGAATGRWALWLAFAPPGGQAFDDSVRLGQVVVADVHFYPGGGQARILVGERSDAAPEPLAVQGFSLLEVRRAFAELAAADPWTSRMPAAVEATPVRDDAGGWWLVDTAGAGCPLLGLDGQAWPLLAQSGGDPLVVFGEWNGSGLLPLSVLPDDSGHVLSLEICG